MYVVRFVGDLTTLYDYCVSVVRMMYWLTSNSIDAAAMDGTQHRTVKYINYPSGLALDSQGLIIYGKFTMICYYLT